MEKRKYIPRVAIYLTAERKALIEQFAKEEKRTLSQMAWVLVEEALDARLAKKSSNPTN